LTNLLRVLLFKDSSPLKSMRRRKSARFVVSAFRPRAKERQGTQRISFGDEHLKTNFKSIPLRTSAYLCVMLRRDSLERQKTEIRMQNTEVRIPNSDPPEPNRDGNSVRRSPFADPAQPRLSISSTRSRRPYETGSPSHMPACRHCRFEPVVGLVGGLGNRSGTRPPGPSPR
jgi:hypothetical protein